MDQELRKLFLGLLSPIFLFGLIFNAAPFFIIDTITRKIIKDKGFWSTFFLSLGIILFPIFYLLEFFAVSWLIVGIWLKITLLVAMPFAGKTTFLWYILFRKTVGRIRLFILKVFHKKEFKSLFKQKEILFGKLDEVISVK